MSDKADLEVDTHYAADGSIHVDLKVFVRDQNGAVNGQRSASVYGTREEVMLQISILQDELKRALRILARMDPK